jgi:hypothetical protein
MTLAFHKKAYPSLPGSLLFLSYFWRKRNIVCSSYFFIVINNKSSTMIGDCQLLNSFLITSYEKKINV